MKEDLILMDLEAVKIKGIIMDKKTIKLYGGKITHPVHKIKYVMNYPNWKHLYNDQQEYEAK